MRKRTIAGALGVAVMIGGGIAAVPAAAHPNLAVDTSVSCAGIDYGVTGIDQGTSVSVKTFHQVNGFQNFTTYTWSDTSAPSVHVNLPAQYQGQIVTLTSTIESEGKTDQAGPVTLDCRVPPAPPATTTPPPPSSATPPPPTCGELRERYPKAGVRFWRSHGCKPPTAARSIRNKPEVCKAPATLAIDQQQKGTFYTQIYPLAVTIRNTTGATTPKAALILTDSGLQNFVGPNGERTERLVIPVGPMRRGQVRRVERMMGFVGVEAFKAVFTTRAQFMVNGRRCGFTSDKAFEG